jgi:hypothetical protein
MLFSEELYEEIEEEEEENFSVTLRHCIRYGNYALSDVM